MVGGNCIDRGAYVGAGEAVVGGDIEKKLQV